MKYLLGIFIAIFIASPSLAQTTCPAGQFVKVIQSGTGLLATCATPAPVQAMTDTPPSATMTPVTAGVATGNAWLLSNFAYARQYTGTFAGVKTIVFPALVKNVTCTGGYYCLSIFDLNYEHTPPDEGVGPGGTTASTDQRAALVNVTVSNQIVNGPYAAGILFNGNGNGWIDHMEAFLSNVTITPNLPPWVDYATTNFDTITFDGGWPTGKVYMEDVTANGWDDAAFDVKGQSMQAVRIKTNGSGYNTLKLWHAGPHYIVDSVISNSRWNTADPPVGDGGLLATMDCTTAEIRIWNSTFNGSTTLNRNKVRCFYTGTPADIKIKYLSIDPRKTGEMHPMFVAP